MIQKILRWLGEHLSTLLLAFVLAVAVWISAVVAADPNEQRTMRPIDLQVFGQSPTLVIVNEIPDQVRLTLRAPKSIWSKLSEHPELAKSWVDLTGLEPGDYSVEVKTRVDVSPIQFVGADPQAVDIRLEPLVRKEIPIDLVVTGELPLGYQRGDPEINPNSVTISGPESSVSRVAQARIKLNISGAIETINRSETVEILDADGESVSGLSVSSKEIEIFQPISLLGRFKNVAVKIVTTGQVANGYRLTNISVSPPTFTVFSEDPDLINDTPGFVETMPVDLEGLTEDAAISVDLNLPEGLTTVRDPNVLVQVSLAEIEGSLTLTLPVEIVNLTPELGATISPETVDVIIAGPLFVLEQLSPDNFQAVIDVSGLPPGIYQREVVVEKLPDQVRIQTTIPETVEVTIVIAPPVSVTPVVSTTATPLAIDRTATITPKPSATPKP